MKIRIKGNSLRYRLTRSEVDRLGKEGLLEERTEFAGNTLVYSIASSDDVTMSASFVSNQITLHLPKPMIEELCMTDRVGFEERAGTVRLLVEKDFACLDHVEEDQSDNYPNPNLTC